MSILFFGGWPMGGLCLFGQTPLQPQAITWTTPATGQVLRLNQSYPLAATASSGLPVSFKVERGPAKIVDRAVTATALGAVVIVAEQAGDANFASAPPVRRLFNQSSVVFTRLGSVPDYGHPRAVRFHGQLAYLCEDSGFLVVVDVADPARPMVLGNAAVPSGLFGIDHDPSRELVFVATYAGGLQVLDVRNPTVPQLIGSVVPGPYLTGVAVAGNHAFVSASGGGNVGMLVIDISNPARPAVVKTDSLQFSAFDLQLVSRYVYLGNSGLAFVDVSDPTRPVLAGKFESRSLFSESHYVDGRRAYLRWVPNRLLIVDVTDPMQPVSLGSFDSVNEIKAVTAQGSRSYLAESSAVSWLRVLDVSDPKNPVSMGATNTFGDIRGIRAAGDIVWLSLWNSGLTAFHVREGIPQQVQFDAPRSVPIGTTNLTLSATASSDNPVIFEVISGPATVTGNQLTITDAGVITVRATAGNEQFLPATAERTIAVADLPVFTLQPASTNVAPRALVTLRANATGTLPLSYQWYLNGTAIAGARSNTYSFELIDASMAGIYWVIATNVAGGVQSAAVTVSTNLPTGGLTLRPRGSMGEFGYGVGSGAPIRLQVRGNLSYLTDGWGDRFYVLDVVDPDHPRLVGQIALPPGGYPFGVALIDDYALLPARGLGLIVIDLADPVAPTIVRNFRLPGSLANSIAVRDHRAYIGNEDGGLVILNVSDPERPEVIGLWRGRSRANGVALDGDHAYVADWNFGVEVVDVSSPTAPIGLGAYPAEGTPYPGTAFDVLPHANRIYVADSTSGFLVLDVSIPSSPTKVSGLGGNLWGLRRVDRFVFAASDRAGLQIYDVGNASAPQNIGRYAGAGPLIGVHLRGNRLLLGGPQFMLVDVEFPPLAPVLTDQPESRRVIAGASLTLEVAAAGSEPFTYRWRHDGKEIPGANQTRLALTAIAPADAGGYQVEVSNALGTVLSDIAQIEVRAPQIVATTVHHETPGRLEFGVRAAAGSRFAVLVSGNLVDWRELTVLTATGRETPVVDVAAGGAARFYRIETR